MPSRTGRSAAAEAEAMSDVERGDDDTATTSAAYDDDEDEEYEEPDGGNRFLGFMFGNVDDAGDLDADYLDEDAKEHLFALADKLGPSLKDIDSSPAPADPSEQDYDEKAEDAVDYEDIDEQYDGPEVEAATEEEHLLSKKDYFSSNTMFASVSSKLSVSDEENYDEADEEPPNDEIPGDNVIRAAQLDMLPSNDNPAIEKQEEIDTKGKHLQSKSGTSLHVLCIEDGSVILKFSEIFGSQEPVRKAKTNYHKRTVNKGIQQADYKKQI